MPDYRTDMIGRDGTIVNAIEIDCTDDEAAIESAKQLVDGHDIELWQRDRRVAKVNAKPESWFGGKP